MCGILGVISYGNISYIKASAYRKMIRSLLENSQVRGRDASGLLVMSNNNLHLFKNDVDARTLVLDTRYGNLMNDIRATSNFQYAIGHTRAQTKGAHIYNVNNHPIKAGNVIGVHNGTISNDDRLFEEYKEDIKRSGQVDSEIIFRLLDYFLKEGLSIVESVRNTCSLLNGSYVCAFMTTNNPRYVTLFKDNKLGSLSLYISKESQTIVFASTASIVRNAMSDIKELGADIMDSPIEIEENGIRIDTMTGKIHQFDIDVKEKKNVATVNNWRNLPIYCGLVEMNFTDETAEALCDGDCQNCSYNNCG